MFFWFYMFFSLFFVSMLLYWNEQKTTSCVHTRCCNIITESDWTDSFKDYNKVLMALLIFVCKVVKSRHSLEMAIRSVLLTVTASTEGCISMPLACLMYSFTFIPSLFSHSWIHMLIHEQPYPHHHHLLLLLLLLLALCCDVCVMHPSRVWNWNSPLADVTWLIERDKDT